MGAATSAKFSISSCGGRREEGRRARPTEVGLLVYCHMKDKTRRVQDKRATPVTALPLLRYVTWGAKINCKPGSSQQLSSTSLCHILSDVEIFARSSARHIVPVRNVVAGEVQRIDTTTSGRCGRRCIDFRRKESMALGTAHVIQEPRHCFLDHAGRRFGWTCLWRLLNLKILGSVRRQTSGPLDRSLSRCCRLCLSTSDQGHKACRCSCPSPCIEVAATAVSGQRSWPMAAVRSRSRNGGASATGDAICERCQRCCIRVGSTS